MYGERKLNTIMMVNNSSMVKCEKKCFLPCGVIDLIKNAVSFETKELSLNDVFNNNKNILHLRK